MSTELWLVAGLVAFLLASTLVIALTVERGKSTSTANLPYEKEPHLLTQGARAFYRILLRSIGPDVTIFAKVRLIDLVRVRKGTEKARLTRSVSSPSTSTSSRAATQPLCLCS
ncbi:MAG TPA: DUF2726 domain-containing protein [Chloroflexia bacterium]|nr:DUF2726 domain-containing protein [Chloroflexia bacterium]